VVCLNSKTEDPVRSNGFRTNLNRVYAESKNFLLLDRLDPFSAFPRCGDAVSAYLNLAFVLNPCRDLVG